jgi:ABC-type multidrug transport system fused ATPase/permease subunit
MRIQQGAVSIKGSIGAATPTLNLIDQLKNVSDIDPKEQFFSSDHKGFVPEASLKNVSLIYPTSTNPALEFVNLEIKQGEFVAIVGPSGAGKTSLVDVLLGILNPTEGYVDISGLTPLEAFAKWPGAVSYLPQDIEVIDGSIRKNLCLGLDFNKVSDDELWDALDAAHLRELVESLPEKLDAPMGERGMKISGGQRQRLGIARALLCKPKLIVFDEATSALDGETESRVTDSLLTLKGEITIVMIAHRLSTIKEADMIYVLEDGKISARGNFETLRHSNPQFANQAHFMGL